MEETEPTMFIVTCRTPGCISEGKSEEAPLFPNAAEPVWRAICCNCGQTPELVPA